MRFSVISLLALCLHVAADEDTMPVFIMDNRLLDNVTRGEQMALHRTDKSDFEKILDAADIFAGTVVFFLEQSFCLEDVSQRDSKGTGFPHLHKSFKDKKTKFYLNVRSPHKLIEDKFPPTKENVFFLQEASFPIILDRTKAPKHMYIFFDDVDENKGRIEYLRRHDKMLKEVMQELNDVLRGPVVSFYTGKWNPIVLDHRPRAEAEKKKPETNGTRIVQRHEYLVECGRSLIRFWDPVLTTHLGEVNAVLRTCEGNDSQRSYKLMFNEKLGGGKDYSIWITFSEKYWDGWPYFDFNSEFQYLNHTNHSIASWLPPKLRDGRDPWRWYNYLGPVTNYFWCIPFDIFMKPEDEDKINLPLTVRSLQFMYYDKKIKADAPIGQENVKIREIVHEYLLYPPDLLISVPILMAYIVGIIWFSMLAFAIKMLLSIRTNDQFDPPGFQGVLHRPEPEEDD